MGTDRKITSSYTSVGETKVHYLSGGEGKPVLFIHGWPTYSKLFRNVLPHVAATHRVYAPDMPGFGLSDKPWNVSYSHDYHARFLDAYLSTLGVSKVSLVLHDVGVPTGLLWAVRNPGRTERIVVLNSLFDPDGAAGLFYVYPVSWLKRHWILFTNPEATLMLKALLFLAHTPLLQRAVFSMFGLSRIFQQGILNRAALSRELISDYQKPFSGKGGTRLLAKTFFDARLEELREIADNLGRLTMPVQILYGKEDKLLPGLAREMETLRSRLPDAKLATLEECGHYLLEDNPDAVARIIHRFMNGIPTGNR